jgi:hypothetical protein
MCHPGDVPNTRWQCAKATDQWAQGGQRAKSPGRSAWFHVGLAHAFVHTCPREKEKAKAVEKVSGGQTTWLAGHVARPVGHHMVSY